MHTLSVTANRAECFIAAFNCFAETLCKVRQLARRIPCVRYANPNVSLLTALITAWRASDAQGKRPACMHSMLLSELVDCLQCRSMT